MHFPNISSTLPRRWKMSSSDSGRKPPKSSRKVSGKPPRPLVHRSASFSQDEEPIFKVPQLPRPPRPKYNNTECPTCQSDRDWRSRSMMDLKPASSSEMSTFKKPLLTFGSRPVINKCASQDYINRAPVKPNKHNSSSSYSTASIFSNNLRSNSWRNLTSIGRSDSFGGMNRSHRLSQGAKKVTPPSIPSINPRGSGSSFGSDYSFERDEGYSRAPAGRTASPGFTRLSFEADVIPKRNNSIPKSPGRDSPGDESSASIATVESVSSGCRNSTTSLDSGRASNSNSNSTAESSSSTFHTIQPIHEHRAMVAMHPVPPTPPRLSSYPSSVGSSFRQSYHSSTSSLGSVDRGEDSICALDINEMIANSVVDHEILLAWLTDLHHEDYYDLFVSAGYDMPTISKMTPEDLTAIGIKKPNHRKRLKAEITKLAIPDGLPNFIPPTLEEWLHLVRLSEYTCHLQSQGYLTIDELTQISIEDFEDIGVYKLGHQKRLLLAIKRAKDLKSGRRIAQYPNNVVRHTNNNPSLPLRPAPEQHRPSSSGFSSFQHQQQQQQQQQIRRPSWNGTLEPPCRSVVYQPEVIRIERQPHTMMRPASISPPPPPPPPKVEGMPQPMAPLQYSRYQQSFGPDTTANIPNNWGGRDMIRSYDDADIATRMHRERVLVHHARDLSGGGGTLPRLGKNNTTTVVVPTASFIKPRPVAKIVAKTRESPQPPPLSLSDVDPKSKVSSFSPVHRPLKQSSDKSHSDAQSINSCGEGESFPFANDHAGTIRMRSNCHVPLMHDDNDDDDGNDDDDEDDVAPIMNSEHQPTQAQTNSNAETNEMASQSPSKGGPGQRTAGDVLNDIGSMLADLTDELDAMLHMERDPAAPKVAS